MVITAQQTTFLPGQENTVSVILTRIFSGSILAMRQKPLLTGGALKDKATALGIDLMETRNKGRFQKQPEDLQREIREHERSIREGRLWIIAVVSAAASVLSSVSAFIAVLSS